MNVFHENDVLCGQSPTYRLQPGNAWLRGRVLADYDRYERSSKQEKARLSGMIVEEVGQRGGHFLKNTPSYVWEPLSYLDAHDKVASMFRSERKRRRREAMQLDSFPESISDPSDDDQLIQMFQNDPDFLIVLGSLYQDDLDVQMLPDSF